MSPSNFKSLLKNINDSPSMFATELIEPKLGFAHTPNLSKGRFIEAFISPEENGLNVRVVNSNYSRSYIYQKIRTDLMANGFEAANIEFKGLQSGDTITVFSNRPAPLRRQFNATEKYFALGNSSIRCKGQFIGEAFEGNLQGQAFNESCETVGVESIYAKYTLI